MDLATWTIDEYKNGKGGSLSSLPIFFCLHPYFLSCQVDIYYEKIKYILSTITNRKEVYIMETKSYLLEGINPTTNERDVYYHHGQIDLVKEVYFMLERNGYTRLQIVESIADAESAERKIVFKDGKDVENELFEFVERA